MRLWLRRKKIERGGNRVIHEFSGTDTSCFAVQTKGLKLENYNVIGKVYADEKVCQACQFAIAERRGKF